jgi:hypothetical protein
MVEASGTDFVTPAAPVPEPTYLFLLMPIVALVGLRWRHGGIVRSDSHPALCSNPLINAPTVRNHYARRPNRSARLYTRRMLGCGARLDELNFFLRTTFQVDDPEAVTILVSALIDCPRTKPLWFILETNWYSRECAPAWFSFGETWKPQSLSQLRALRPRAANQAITAWLDQPLRPSLFVESDFERLPNWRRISQSPYLLGRTLRLRSVSTPHGATLPVDERQERQRADRLRALTGDVALDRAGLRPLDPPVWREPASFAYHAEIAQRLSGWHQDWGQTVSLLRALGVRHAYLLGRYETDETDWRLLARVAADMIPPWVRRGVEYLAAAPDHKAETRTLARVMGIDPSHHPECARLYTAGLFTYNQSRQIWGLVPEHIPGVTTVVVGRAFEPPVLPRRAPAAVNGVIMLPK